MRQVGSAPAFVYNSNIVRPHWKTTLLIGVLVAACWAPLALATHNPWHVVAQTRSGPNYPVYWTFAQARVKRPKALAIRVWMLRRGHYVPARAKAQVSCGKWKGPWRWFQGQTPHVWRLRFHLFPAVRYCTVIAATQSLDAKTATKVPQVYIQILARWR